MPYSGDVDAYGPADFRLLPDLLVAKLGLGPSGVNGYVLRCLRTEQQLLVDAADDPLFVAAITSSRGLETIVSTHGHAAHVHALAELAETTHAVTVAHASDADALPVPPVRVVGDGDVVTVGEVPLTVIHLPGHSPGSIALLHQPSDGSAPHLFSGDALLQGGTGTTTTVEDDARLRDALRRRVFDVLPDDTWIYPGHGPDTTVGSERARLLATASR
ncbi:MAG: beta-lactamase domain protein [Frankiales bacterium]|jgi:glyoxylase-like metal-dependent hydrolase (beta-lactamase superfamily II)|nr:beta-lactamase domain protein [Frankiales bacterium]